MSIVDQVKNRKAVRSYTSEPLSPEILDKLNTYIKKLSPPFDAELRVELVGTHMGDEPLKLGTYGVISGANYYLALITKKGEMAEMAGGYLFEQVLLYCTELGLGTCWLGATFKSKDFLRHIRLNENEELTMISPIGYKREKKTILESIMRATVRSDNRKPFESLFFKDSFDTSLSPENAGEYKLPLEMVRLAPSASNKQPWRILQEGKSYHFFHCPNYFSMNDIGIALCHFELTCKEFGLEGNFCSLDSVPSTKTAKYVISWLSE